MSYPRERETGIWGTRDCEQLKDAADRNRKSRPGKKMSRSLCLAGYQWMCKTGCLHLDGWRWIESRTLVRDRDPGQTSSTLSYLLQCISLRWLDASNQKHHHWLERKKEVKKRAAHSWLFRSFSCLSSSPRSFCLSYFKSPNPTHLVIATCIRRYHQPSPDF